MASVVAGELVSNGSIAVPSPTNGHDDPFTEHDTRSPPFHGHRYSSRLDLDASALGASASPSQVKRSLEAYLADTQRRLQETQKLGQNLLQHQAELEEKLQEVEQKRDNEQITPELRQRLAKLGQEHEDVSREVARSLLAPKSRAVSGEEPPGSEPGVLTSQATGSPTKLTAPSRRQRNQPTSRAGDLQFAADISTSLLAQVRSLQAALAERDENLKVAHTDRARLEQEAQIYTQKLRSYDENEQKYKDENWNLETQTHELLAAQRDATDREQRLNALVASATAEKTRLQSEIEEVRLSHNQLNEEHVAARKAHETQLHSLKKDVDSADSERTSLQKRIDDLTSQNQELAHAFAGKFRNVSPYIDPSLDAEDKELGRDLETPGHSPPPSPTKATPRHGGLESETLRSSLHHAHRMIQNLKGNIHREKTEKIELKRMLQDARDELEQSRTAGAGSAQKKQKTRNEPFKKPTRPDMLGGNRRPRTDIEVEDETWEDHAGDSPSNVVVTRSESQPEGRTGHTDTSDAYETANDTENAFETADERHATESEAFETGAESLAGDSTDDLTETEDTIPRSRSHVRSVRKPRSSTGLHKAANRNSYLSTASTSGDEDEAESLQTPVQPQPHKFRLKNGRGAYVRNLPTPNEGTPESFRTPGPAHDSPATIMNGRSPAGAGQSLYAELGEFDDASSDRYNTPGRSSVIVPGSHSPSVSILPDAENAVDAPAPATRKPVMVDSETMTEEHEPAMLSKAMVANPIMSGVIAVTSIAPSVEHQEALPLSFPLPPSLPATPAVQRTDTSTQYTPQQNIHESPARNSTAFITPPKTTWDEQHEARSPVRQTTSPANVGPKANFTYSSVFSQHSAPVYPPKPALNEPAVLAFSSIMTQDTRPITPLTATLDPPYKGASSTRAEAATPAATAGGLFATAATALGFGRAKDGFMAMRPEEPAASFPDTPPLPLNAMTESKTPTHLADYTPMVTANAIESEQIGEAVARNDQGSQTMLTADEIEKVMRPAAITYPMPMAGASSPKSIEGVSFPTTPVAKTREPMLDTSATTLSIVKPTSPSRPTSSQSQRGSLLITPHPPLPMDYKSTIAKANYVGAQSGVKPESSVHTGATVTVMGPPQLPASALRRPRTPGESIKSVSRDNAGQKALHSSRYQRNNISSQVSRRSSVSSFASELDERFNIRTGHPFQAGTGFDATPGTDPRMIQAITQTMIGEYLWKYTRKTGNSKEMSNNRHRRYFWVHPYTKTLYWSSVDPQTAGGKQFKSNSVSIESVRVVTDDNPMPPGLHRKSLEIMTPGRRVKFTASTGQRHETWFNALSYLLMRGDPNDEHQTYVNGEGGAGEVNDMTADDMNEFAVGGYGTHLTANASRLSMSSYNSRTTRGTNRNSRQALPSNVVATSTKSRQSGAPMASLRTGPSQALAESQRNSRTEQPETADRDRTIRAKSMSRISKLFSSVAGRHSEIQFAEDKLSARPQSRQSQSAHRRQESGSSIYDASIVSDPRRDSQEQMREEMLRQEAVGLGHRSSVGLENVRACCDGKHDVSSLNHQHSTARNRMSSMTDRINRSMSKRL